MIAIFHNEVLNLSRLSLMSRSHQTFHVTAVKLMKNRCWPTTFHIGTYGDATRMVYELAGVINPSNLNQFMSNRGPLRTRAMCRDHEIVRARKKLSKGRPNTPLESCHVITDPQVYRSLQAASSKNNSKNRKQKIWKF